MISNSIMPKVLVTAESFSSGNSDKLCDRISETILDDILQIDPLSQNICKTFATRGKIIVGIEHNSPMFDKVIKDWRCIQLARKAIHDVGYNKDNFGVDPDDIEIEVYSTSWLPERPQFVPAHDRVARINAGSELGVDVFGFATDETPALMPLAQSLATDLIATGTQILLSGRSPLRPDARSQVTLQYLDGQPAVVNSVALSWQHDFETHISQVRDFLVEKVIDEVIPHSLRASDFRVVVNPEGAWTLGGPQAYVGVTGHKFIADTYGGACPHTGDSFSGMGPSRVQRLGAYAARWVAKTIVAAGLARKCTVRLSFGPDFPCPTSFDLDALGTERVSEDAIRRAVKDVFDLSPSRIMRDLNLWRPIYAETSSLGHFGRWRDPNTYLWESTDRTGQLMSAVRGYG